MALANYGYMLANGWGVDKDPERAVGLFEKAAGMGHAGGMVGLGFAHYHGLGVPAVNYSAALHWYRQAADAGDAMGHYNLGEMLRSGTGLPAPDVPAAMAHMRAAAAGGHFKALYIVGLSHWCVRERHWTLVRAYQGLSHWRARRAGLPTRAAKYRRASAPRSISVHLCIFGPGCAYVLGLWLPVLVGGR